MTPEDEAPWLAAQADWICNRPETLAVMLAANPDPPESVRETLADAVRRKLATVEPAALREATEAALLPPGSIPEAARLALVAVIRATSFRKPGVLGELPIAHRKPMKTPRLQLVRDLDDAVARDTTLEPVASRLKARPSVAGIWESALSLWIRGTPEDKLLYLRPYLVDRLLRELLVILKIDPFGTPTEANRSLRWIIKKTDEKRDQLRKVAKAARDLAKGLRDCAGTDQLTVEVFGVKDRYELPRLLEVLAERAAKYKIIQFLPRPEGGRRTYWLHMLEHYLGRGRITDTERNKVIAKLTEAMLDCHDIEPKTVRNSTKKTRKNSRLSRSP